MTRNSVRALCAACGVVLTLLSACTPSPAADRSVRPRTRGGDDLSVSGLSPEAEIRQLERILRFDPRHPRARLALAQAYFRLAQRSLEVGDEPEYTRNLERAQLELLNHMERAPSDPAAHIQLGILAAYRGNFRSSRRSFRIASQLDPRDPIAQQNLAELAVYEDALPEVRRRLRLARSRGIPVAESELIEALAAWKQKDLIEAKRRFAAAKELDPQRVRTWNGASRIETFDDMAAHCCRLRFCGPYMESACGDMNQAVAAQELEEATLLKELQLEMERTRRVREIYERRRDLDIQVDEEGESPEPPDATDP